MRLRRFLFIELITKAHTASSRSLWLSTRLHPGPPSLTRVTARPGSVSIISFILLFLLDLLLLLLAGLVSRTLVGGLTRPQCPGQSFNTWQSCFNFLTWSLSRLDIPRSRRPPTSRCVLPTDNHRVCLDEGLLAVVQPSQALCLTGALPDCCSPT